jgi:hypothetical protein
MAHRAGRSQEADRRSHPVVRTAGRDKIQKINASAGGADYSVATSQSMHEQTLKGVEQGATVAVKVDPDDPQSLLVWGAAG